MPTDSTIVPPMGNPNTSTADPTNMLQSGEFDKSKGELISDEDALKLVNDTYMDYDHGRKPFERQWYRNILFLLGNQWIIWDTLENKWRKKRLADWVPTPVTNKFAASGQRLVSVLSRVEPNWNYTPSSSAEADITAAEQCKNAEKVICEENNIQAIRESVAPWLVYTGNAYLLSGVEPVLGDPIVPPEVMPTEYDLMGAPQEIQDAVAQVAEAPVVDYKLYTDVLAPFEVYKDQTIEKFEDQSKILVVNRRSREYVKNLWGEDIDELDVAPNIHYQESIGYVTSSPEITGFLASLSRIKRVTVKRLFYKPTSEYPKGLYIVTAGSKIVEKGTLPLSMTGDKGFVPLSHIKFDNIPGAAFGRTPMDDIVHKQIQRNKIESLIELIALRMGSPIWLMPEGTTVRNFSGSPGAIVTYNLVGDKATKPDRIPGEQIPTSIVQFLAQIDKDIEDLVSTFEALKGQSPYSGAPGVVIEQLIEQGLTRFGPSLRNVAEGYRQWMKHQLEFFRRYGIAEKTIMASGRGSQWTATKFKGADILGSVNVTVESDSTIPRSSQVEVAKIVEAINSKLIDISDPSVRQKILQKLKIQDLKDEVEGDIVTAVKENDVMVKGQPVQVFPLLDNHLVHVYEHKKFANSDAGTPVKQLIMKHVAEHMMLHQAEITPGGPQPAPGPGGRRLMPPPPGGAPTPSPQGGHISPAEEKKLAPGQGAKGELPPNIM